MMWNELSALDAALELLCRGLWPVPIHPAGVEIPDGKGGTKVATGKEPIGKAWGKEADRGQAKGRIRGEPQSWSWNPTRSRGRCNSIEVDGPGGEESLTRLMGGEIGTRWDGRAASGRITCSGSTRDSASSARIASRIIRLYPAWKFASPSPGLSFSQHAHPPWAATARPGSGMATRK